MGVGGSDDDNLFQWPTKRLEPQLALVRGAGGNYVRNSTSDRRDGGFGQYPFGHCIDNETSGDAAWSRYWAEYIKTKAKDSGRRVHVTEMWDDWDITAARHRQTLDHPDLYDFAACRQNNHNSGRRHWRNALWARQYVAGRPRPLNAVKTYGADGNRFGHTDRDGLERFFRHILAGFAAVRFHRPDSGLGLTPKAQAAIGALRALESVVGFLDLTPDEEVLSNGKGGDVYAAKSGTDRRVLYFPSGGRTTLPLAPGRYELVWIGLQGLRSREILQVASDDGGRSVTAPDEGHWFAVLQTLLNPR